MWTQYPSANYAYRILGTFIKISIIYNSPAVVIVCFWSTKDILTTKLLKNKWKLVLRIALFVYRMVTYLYRNKTKCNALVGTGFVSRYRHCPPPPFDFWLCTINVMGKKSLRCRSIATPTPRPSSLSPPPPPTKKKKKKETKKEEEEKTVTPLGTDPNPEQIFKGHYILFFLTSL